VRLTEGYEESYKIGVSGGRKTEQGSLGMLYPWAASSGHYRRRNSTTLWFQILTRRYEKLAWPGLPLALRGRICDPSTRKADTGL
jgi:hypothetical protein